MTEAFPDALLKRFEEKFLPEPNSGCWLWEAAEKVKGYGGFSLGGGHIELAHRASWLFYRGALGPGECVLHKCDNGFCVNPRHLFLGDKLANNRDRMSKGRGNLPRGERNPFARLTDERVRAIRCDSGKLREIAARHGISVPAAGKIRQRKAWPHVD